MKSLFLLKPYLRKQQKKLLWGLACIVIFNACAVAVPFMVSNVIDILRNTASGSYADILPQIGYIILLTSVGGFFLYLTRRTIIVASRLIEYDLRNDLLLAVTRQDSTFFRSRSTGALMALSTNDVNAVREFLGPAIMYSANTVASFLFVFSAMFSQSPPLTLMAILPLPLMAYATYTIGKRVHVAFKQVQETYSDMTVDVQEALSGVRVVRAYVREEFEREKFTKISELYATKNIRLARLQSLTMPVMMGLIGLSNIVVLGYGGYLTMNNQLSEGVLVQFLLYINRLIWPVAAIGWVTNLVQRAAASSQRIIDVLHHIPTIKDNEITNLSIEHLVPSIEFRNVSFRYLPNSLVLNNISFSIKSGGSLGIVGGVGTGKTTIVQLLSRLIEPSNGEIFIGGEEYRTIPIEILRKNMSVAPQEPFLFSMSIEQNIAFSQGSVAEQQIVDAAIIAELHNEIIQFEHKYKTLVGERGITLSGGQKQRTALARALARNPQILIFDDVFSAIDTATEHKIQQNLKNAMKEKTTIIVAHRLSSVQHCDEIIVLENGAIAERGTHKDLLLLQGLYSEMFERQQLEKELQLNEN